MRTFTTNRGRLCNQIIRNLAVSLIAEKNDLFVDYFNFDLIKSLGIDLFVGKNVYDTIINLDDENYFHIYNSKKINSNLFPNNAFFQTKEITNFLHKHLHSDKIKSEIMNKNPFKERYNNNNDLFIHIRLTDTAQWNPGAYYYLKVIENIHFDNLYISTDEPTHAIIKEIIDTYPSTKLNNYDEVNTIQFGSTCKHIILSHGSFSAVLGYLSFFSTIHYPEYEDGKIWYGDMFSINGWIKHNVK